MCRDNSHHLLFFFLYLLVFYINSSVTCLKFAPKWSFFLFSAYFGGHVCYHSNRKSRINVRLLHLGYCSNKLIRRNLWKGTFIFWPHRGAKIALNARTLLYEIGFLICCTSVSPVWLGLKISRYFCWNLHVGAQSAARPSRCKRQILSLCILFRSLVEFFFCICHSPLKKPTYLVYSVFSVLWQTVQKSSWNSIAEIYPVYSVFSVLWQIVQKSSWNSIAEICLVYSVFSVLWQSKNQAEIPPASYVTWRFVGIICDKIVHVCINMTNIRQYLIIGEIKVK